MPERLLCGSAFGRSTSSLVSKHDHDIVEIMATRRHFRGAFLILLAAFLILPPLTGAVAQGFGIDLTHHHCDSHVALSDFHGSDTDDLDVHGEAESDPFHCDQCHMVLAALSNDLPRLICAPAVLPQPELSPMLSSVRIPPAFKPPIP